MINIQKHIISEAFEQLSKSAKLKESKVMESNTQFDIHAVLNANGDYEDLTEVVKDPSRIIIYDTWDQMLKDRDNLHTYYIRQNGDKEYEIMKYSKWSGDQYVGYVGPHGYSSLKELYDRNPGKYDTDDVCLVKEFHLEEKLSESKFTEATIPGYKFDKDDIDMKIKAKDPELHIRIKDAAKLAQYLDSKGIPYKIRNIQDPVTKQKLKGFIIYDYFYPKKNKSEKVDESKLSERYSFPEVDDALNHFWNDLGKDPEVDDVIGFLEDEYPDWVPTDPEDYGRWYHDVAGEISARLSESKLTEKILDKDVYTIGIYGDEIPGFNSVRQFIEYLERKGLKIHDFDGDMDYGWDITVSGPARILYNEINNKIPGYHSASIDDFFDEYSLDELDESLKESKLTEAPMDVKDYAAKLRARKAEKGQNPLEKINSQIDPDMSITDQLQVYFDELVPASGPAKTVAGELVRAIMRILYRDYNDGDLWYTGYGKETCGDSVVYLIEHIEDLQDLFEDMIYKEMEDAEYTDALEDVASRVMVYLNEHPELFTTPLDKDSRSGADLESYFDLPTYEFEPDTSYDDSYYDVSDDDIDEFIHDIVESDFRGATVNRWARDGWTIEGLDKEQLEYLEDVWEKWFNDFLSQYEREEEPEEDYEDEDETAEADWDDSTDSEFDESLSLSKLHYRQLAHDPSTDPDTLAELAKDKDTRLAVAKNPSTSFETLLKLSKSRDPEVKKAALAGLDSYYFQITGNNDDEFGWTDADFDESLKDNQKRGRKMKIVAEDFQECNLNKMGTNEYEANTNRQKHINMYRKFANLNDDEVITEDMIDDLALTKTATYCNREPDRIRAEILGQRYSEYEQ